MSKHKKSRKHKGDQGGIVYSTDPNFAFKDAFEKAGLSSSESSPGSQTLYLVKDRKGRGGKTATIVEGFKGSDEELNDLGKELKQKCGVGGSVKDGEIIIQGDKRDKIREILEEKGFKTKLKGS